MLPMAGAAPPALPDFPWDALKSICNSNDMKASGGSASCFLGTIPEYGEVIVKKIAAVVVEGDSVDVAFRNEVAVLARVAGRCSFVVRVLGACTQGVNKAGMPQRAIVLEYVEGGSLEDVLNTAAVSKAPAFGEARILGLAADIARGLQFLHGNRIAHLDVKPGNVLLRLSGAAVLIDFGLSKTIETVMTVTSSVVGTRQYMAPEQYRASPGDSPGTEADVWALGCLLCELSRGHKPWVGPNSAPLPEGAIREKVLVQRAAPPLPPPGMPTLRRVAEMCLKHAPRDRATIDQVPPPLRALTYIICRRLNYYYFLLLPSFLLEREKLRY